MKKPYKLMVMLLMLQSCALLQKKRTAKAEAKQNTKMESSAKTVVNSQFNNRAEQFTLQKDDTRSDFTIRFWPKSELKFMPGEGFTGEFDSILMHGSQRRNSEAQMSLNINKNVKQAIVLQSQDKRSASDSKKSVSKLRYTDIRTMIAVILMLVCAVIMISRVKKYS